MGLLGTVSNYVWIPYLILCAGLLVVFGTQEFLLLKRYNLAIDEEQQYLTRNLFRRDVGASQEDALADWLSNNPTNDVSVLRQLLDDEQITQPSIRADFETREMTASGLKMAKTEPTKVSTEPEMAPKKLLLSDDPLMIPNTDKNAEGNEVEMEAPHHLEKQDGGSLAPSEDTLSASVEELRPLMPPFGRKPVNSNFIFHNKIPKAGSTTMKWLLVALSKRNGFTLDHARWCLNNDRCNDVDENGQRIDGPDGEEALIDYIPKQRAAAKSENYFLIKHHHWFNFTAHGMEQPTYINVARDPVTRYASWYYFERFGWARKQGTRARFFGEEEDKDRTLDECVQGNHAECLEPVQVLVKYFCGTDSKKCGMMEGAKTAGQGHDWTKVRDATERAKRIIAQEFYVVGVLEHFRETLQLFEKMLPEYYSGAPEISQTAEQQRQRESSKSSNPGFSNSTREALESGVLRYEVDVYNLVKAMFYEKLKDYDIPSPL